MLTLDPNEPKKGSTLSESTKTSFVFTFFYTFLLLSLRKNKGFVVQKLYNSTPTSNLSFLPGWTLHFILNTTVHKHGLTSIPREMKTELAQHKD